MNDGIAAFILMIVVFAVGFLSSIGIFDDAISKGKLVQEAVKECEVTLPRNQHCVPVYSAEVSDE